MGQLLSRQNSNEPLDIDGDEQYFDCLNLNDDSYEQEDKSHHYAVWIPPELEIPGRIDFSSYRHFDRFERSI